MIELDGWQQVWQKESHRQYHHPIKSGTVAVAGILDVPSGTLISVLKRAGLKQQRFIWVIRSLLLKAKRGLAPMSLIFRAA